MNTHHGTIFVIIFVVLIFIAPRYAFGQIDHAYVNHPHAQMQMPQMPVAAEEPSGASPTQMKIEYPESEPKSMGWTRAFLSQITEFDHAVLLFKKATASTSEDRKIAVEKMLELASNGAEAEKTYALALECKTPCKAAGLKAFDKMVGLAKEFSDIEAILRITAHSALESPMIEPDAKQLKVARVKVIELADTKWQLMYVFQRMPAGSKEETLALAKLNTFEK